MKKWTVMVLPEGHGNTTTLRVSAAHVYTLVGILVVLAFTSAFFFRRSQVMAQSAAALQKEKAALQFANGAPRAPVEAALDGETVAEIEDRIRAEYASKDDRILTELGALYDLEQEVRNITGLPPREPATGEESAVAGGGKGGAPDPAVALAELSRPEVMRPSSVIYGLANPPADLIVQEIHVRIASYREFLEDALAQKDRIARTPSRWPSSNARRLLTSGFGYRRDPLGRSLQHHDGVDISAPHGSAVLSTARGTVVFSGYDRWLGNLIKIDHGDGLETWYAHLSERLVQEGDIVERGGKIGSVGSTGRSTGAHIHYEVRINGKPIDPAKYLGG